MSETNVWKLQDAKARFSQLVRRARTGEPQQVTVHGKEAVLVVDPERFEVRRKDQSPPTLAALVEASKPYRGVTEGIDFEPRLGMHFDLKRSPFDEDDR